MVPVILSGGSGSRLWPVSRLAHPKQFSDLLDESLFDKTLKRLAPLGSPWVVTVGEMRTLTERSLKLNSHLGGVAFDQVIYEPEGKNTAPAVALLCRRMQMLGRSADVVGIFPADHLISDEAEFHRVVKRGAELAEQGHVVTLGIQPTHAATGYGYIETEVASASARATLATSSAAADASMKANAVERPVVAVTALGFREKPNEETARQFLQKGGFYWNAGMFIFRVETMIDLFAKLAPDVWQLMQSLREDLGNLEDVYKTVRAISVDYAIMERLTKHMCIPCQFGWSDLGSWDSIAEVLAVAPERKVNSVEVESRDNFVFPHYQKTYGFVGVDDLIVVDTADALLVAKRGETELVKELVDRLKKDGNQPKVIQHRFEVRPWGRFEILSDAEAYKAKTITVDPGAQISYQSHAKRSEHWIIISGQGEVVLDEKVIAVGPSSHVHVAVGTKHRIRNNGTEPLQFVEVQTGTYFGEDDIVRFQDDYQRR